MIKDNLFDSKYFFIDGKNLDEYSFEELKNIVNLLMKDKVFNILNYIVNYNDIDLNIYIENINKIKLVLIKLILNIIGYKQKTCNDLQFLKLKNNINRQYFFNDDNCDMLMVFKYYNEDLKI